MVERGDGLLTYVDVKYEKKYVLYDVNTQTNVIYNCILFSTV
jgi:hypothetical protein